jgi:hypothetical protein
VAPTDVERDPDSDLAHRPGRLVVDDAEDPDACQSPERSFWRIIVWIAGNVCREGLAREEVPRFSAPVLQDTTRGSHLLVRTKPDPLAIGPALRERVRVLQLASGPSSGAVFIPEVGDEVLVSFLEGDPSQPFVLGSLYNGADPPPPR